MKFIFFITLCCATPIFDVFAEEKSIQNKSSLNDKVRADTEEQSPEADSSYTKQINTSDNLGIEDDDSVLDFDQYEKLALFSHGLAFSFGRAIPWQKLSLTYYKKITDTGSRYLRLSLGGGYFTMSGTNNDLDYEIKTDAYSLAVSYRYYFTEFANFYLEPMGSVGYWSGKSGAGGVDADDETAQEIYTNEFNTAGVILAGNFGIMWQFSNGLFIDYSILRMSYSIPLYGDYEQTNKGEEMIQGRIIGPILWGSVNLTLGYMF